MTIKWAFRVGVFATGFIFPSIIFAAPEKDIFSLSIQELSNVEVSTGSKYKENISDSPANIFVVTRQQIDQRGYKSLDELLLGLPGIDFQNYTYFTSLNIFTFRGHQGNNKFLILQDGVRVGSAAGETITVAKNFPLFYAKQVEVLFGPASVIYGSDAFLGVVNIITPDASDENEISVLASIGENQFHEASVFSHQTFSNGINMTFGIHSYRSQNFDFGDQFPEFFSRKCAFSRWLPLRTSSSQSTNFHG